MVSAIETAKALCRYWHHGQTDKAGRPYWEHPYAVAEILQANGPGGISFRAYETAITAAYLHDVLEDTECTSTDLRNAGLPGEVVGYVQELTRAPSEPYPEYIDRLALASKGVILVKLADLEHNLSEDRRHWLEQGWPRQLPVKLVRRYWEAQKLLSAAVEA